MLLATVFLFISMYVFLFLWLIIQYEIYWVKWCGPDKVEGFDLCKLAILHKCLYNMYALLFLVSVLFDDWRFQKEFFNQCAVLCLLWMSNCWWFDISFCRMIHMFMLGFIVVSKVFLYYCLQFYASSVTFYIDLLAFFSVFLCMLNSSHSSNVFIMPFKS